MRNEYELWSIEVDAFNQLVTSIQAYEQSESVNQLSLLECYGLAWMLGEFVIQNKDAAYKDGISAIIKSVKRIFLHDMRLENDAANKFIREIVNLKIELNKTYENYSQETFDETLCENIKSSREKIYKEISNAIQTVLNWHEKNDFGIFALGALLEPWLDITYRDCIIIYNDNINLTNINKFYNILQFVLFVLQSPTADSINRLSKITSLNLPNEFNLLKEKNKILNTESIIKPILHYKDFETKLSTWVEKISIRLTANRTVKRFFYGDFIYINDGFQETTKNIKNDILKHYNNMEFLYLSARHNIFNLVELKNRYSKCVDSQEISQQSRKTELFLLFEEIAICVTYLLHNLVTYLNYEKRSSFHYENILTLMNAKEEDFNINQDAISLLKLVSEIYHVYYQLYIDNKKIHKKLNEIHFSNEMNNRLQNIQEIFINIRNQQQNRDKKINDNSYYQNKPMTVSLGWTELKDYDTHQNYFVDKSLFIKHVLEEKYERVLFFGLPSGFGKTTNLLMLHRFLSADKYHLNNKNLFKKLKIWDEDNQTFRKYFGKYPVIYLNFFAIEGGNFHETLNNLQHQLFQCYLEYEGEYEDFLYKSGEKENIISQVLRKKCTEEEIIYSFQTFIEFVNKKHSNTLYLLIDNFDALVNVENDVALLNFMKNLFSTLLNPSINIRTIIASKTNSVDTNPIYSNEYVNILSENSKLTFRSDFGFTKEEVKTLLEFAENNKQLPENSYQKMQEAIEQYKVSDLFQISGQDVYWPSGTLRKILGKYVDPKIHFEMKHFGFKSWTSSFFGAKNRNIEKSSTPTQQEDFSLK